MKEGRNGEAWVGTRPKAWCRDPPPHNSNPLFASCALTHCSDLTFPASPTLPLGKLPSVHSYTNTYSNGLGSAHPPHPSQSLPLLLPFQLCAHTTLQWEGSSGNEVTGMTWVQRKTRELESSHQSTLKSLSKQYQQHKKGSSSIKHGFLHCFCQQRKCWCNSILKRGWTWSLSPASRISPLDFWEPASGRVHKISQAQPLVPHRLELCLLSNSSTIRHFLSPLL